MAAVCTAFQGCRNDPGPGSPPGGTPEIAVALGQSAVAVPVAGVQPFGASVTGTQDSRVVWSVDGVVGGNALVGTISSAGVYAAPSAVPAAGHVAVAATSAADPSRSAKADVRVVPFALPASTAAGIALGAAASSAVSANGRWSDDVAVVLIAALDAVAKDAANSGRRMSAAEYTAFADAMRSFLLARVPPAAVLAADGGRRLQAAIHAACSMAGSFLAGSAERRGLARLEALAFTELQPALDPSRHADVGSSDGAAAAATFIVARVVEAFGLAQDDPGFAAAVGAILKELVGLDTAARYPEIRARYPDAVPLFPDANAEGAIAVSGSELTDRHAEVMAVAQAGIDAALAEMAAPPVAPLRFESAGAADGGTDGGTARCDARDRIPKSTRCWSEARNAVIGVSNAISFLAPYLHLSPRLAGDVKRTGEAVVGFGAALSAFLAARAAGSLSFSQLGLIVNVAQAAGKIFGLFKKGAGGEDPNAVVLQQIKKLSEQIAELGRHLDERFDHVDAELKLIFDTMNKNFARIDFQLGVLDADAHAIQVELLDLQATLERMQRYTLAYSQAQSKEALVEQLNGCLDYRNVHGGEEIGAARYASCETSFYTWAHDNALNELWAGLSSPDYTDAAVFNTLSTLPLSVGVNWLAQFPARNLVLPALSDARLPNPNEWALGARAYLQLAHEWPALAAKISSSRLQGLVQRGVLLQQAVQNANTIRTTTPAANQALFDAVGRKYDDAVASVDGALQGAVATFTSDPTNPMNARMQGLTIWGGPTQRTDYRPAVYSSTSVMPMCSGAPTYSRPIQLSRWLSAGAWGSFEWAALNLPRLAEEVGVGDLTYCLNYKTVPAGTSGALATGAPVIGIYEIEGRSNGKLAFLQAIRTLGDAACGPDALWEDVQSCGARGGTNAYLVTPYSWNQDCHRLDQLPSAAGQVTSPTADFNALLAKNYFACLPTHSCSGSQAVVCPLKLAFHMSEHVDTPAPRAALTADVAGVFRGYQRGLYGYIGGELAKASALQSAAQQLSAAKLLAQAYASFGLPRTVQDDDQLHELLYGGRQMVDGTMLKTDFLGFAAAELPDTTDNKVAGELALVRARSAQYAAAATAALDRIVKSGSAESPPLVDATLERLRAYMALKDADALSVCDVRLSSPTTALGSGGGSVVLEVSAPAGCAWTATAGAPWLQLAAPAQGSGSATISLQAAANAAGSLREAALLVGGAVHRVVQVPGP